MVQEGMITLLSSVKVSDTMLAAQEIDLDAAETIVDSIHQRGGK